MNCDGFINISKIKTKEAEPKVKFFNVLIIEDELNISNAYVKILKSFKKSQISCICCTNPFQAINIIYQKFIEEKKFFNLIITDDSLPYMNGMAFVELYKESFEKIFYKVDFVLISGNNISDYDQYSIRYFKQIFNKPIKTDQLHSLIW